MASAKPMTTNERDRLVTLIAELDGPTAAAAADALRGLRGALQQVALTYMEHVDSSTPRVRFRLPALVHRAREAGHAVAGDRRGGSNP
jgi:hypothetical protein